jgi:hypothetical protein
MPRPAAEAALFTTKDWPAPGRSQEAYVESAGGRSRSLVSLIIRDDRLPFYPDLRERIKVGDELLVVVPAVQRGKIEDAYGPWRAWSAHPITRWTKNEFGDSTFAVTATRRLFTMAG